MKSKKVDKLTNNIIREMRRDRESEVLEKEDIFRYAFKDKESSKEVIKLINTIIKHSQNYEINVSSHKLSISSNVEKKLRKKGTFQTQPVPSNSMIKSQEDEVNVPVSIDIYKKGFTLSIRYGYNVFKDKNLFNLFEEKFIELNRIKIRKDFKASIDSLISTSNLKRGSVLDELLID